MKKNIVKEKSFELAIEIVKACKFIKEEKKEFVMSEQMLRSGTAIGALVREAEQAESRKDFIHKLSISLKECNETEYWLDLLKVTGYFKGYEFDILYNKNKEVLRLLISIIKKSRG